jgi:predicted Zn-dependent protease
MWPCIRLLIWNNYPRGYVMTRYFPVLLMLSLLLGSCAKNPASGKQDFVMLSEKEELKIGQQIFHEMKKNMLLLPEKDPLARYVDRVGQKVAATSDRPELFYRFYVVDDTTINAFALPGGYIFMHRGLINHMNNEAELAAVLGHEIGHVTARHSVQQISKARAYQMGMAITSVFVPIPQGAGVLTDLMAMAIIQGYGREAELQSDELSIRYLTKAGYDPNATIGILKTLKRLDELDTKEKTDAGEKVEKYHGAFATHPKTENRIKEAIAEAASTQGSAGFVNQGAFLAAVEGYAYGDSTEQGAVVGRHFLHPDLGIQLEFPTDWVITNTASALHARLRQQKVYFRLQVRDLQLRQSAEEILKEVFTDRHIGRIETNTTNGMPHAHAFVRQSAPHVSTAMIDANIFLRGSKAFELLMWSERDTFDKHSGMFRQIANSFRDYDKERDGDIPRIRLHVWKTGDSWESQARKSHNILGRFTAEKLAALNGMELSELPKNGTVVKIVQ